MTDNHTPHFLKRLKGIALSSNERLMMRERLAAYADMHPTLDATASGTSIFTFFASRRFSLYAGALMAFLVVSSGVTFAAEGSVPGDHLYAIKVNVNEPVMTVFSPTATGQAKVAAEIATRRADEAVVLASRGKLTNEHREYLTKEFETRLKIATRKTDELTQAGKSVEAATVKAMLAANIAGEAQALGAVDDEGNEGQRAFLRVLVAVNEHIEGDDIDAATAVTIAVSAQADEDTSATSEEPVTLMAKSANATTSVEAQRPKKTQFIRLRFASTTLPVRLNTQLNTGRILVPKTDVAIPDAKEPADTTFTGIDH